MRLRIFLNGDKSARERFISLNFIFLRGEFDAILHYPFCFPVFFGLVDQSTQRKHIIRKLSPDLFSRNYQRPQTDMTIAGEVLEFVPLEILRQENNPYILDNTMFIRVMINFNNMPDNLIPYAMNIDPALMNSLQQTMIEQERDKYSSV